MKGIIILFLLLLVSPAFSELTKEDIRTIVKEEVGASEKRMKEYIDLKIDALDDKLSARIDSTNGRIDSLDKSLNGRIDDILTIMIALIALVTAAIAVPQVIMAYRERGKKEMETRQEALQTEIQQLRERLAALENTPS